jgi:hypothetical protein
MILATPPPTITYSCRFDDRSLGPLADALRRDLELLSGSRLAERRSDDIYARVSAALHNANRKDGTLTSPEAFSLTLELLNALPHDIPLPTVVVEADGNIGLDWDEGARQVVSLTVRDTPMVGFSALLGAEPLHGRTPFAGEIPQTVRYLLQRLYRQRPNR